MNRWCVPDFELEDEDLIPSASGFCRSNKPSLAEDELVELLWENGELVMHNQSQKSKKPKVSIFPSREEDAITPSGVGHGGEDARRSSAAAAMASEEEAAAANHLFMQEDEMASWLHCPLSLDDDNSSFQRDFCAATADDLIYHHPAPLSNNNNYTSPSNRIGEIPNDRPPPEHNFRVTPPKPPTPPAPSSSSSKFLNFMHFSRPKMSRVDESHPSTSDKIVRGSAVGSSKMLALGSESRISSRPQSMGGGNVAAADRDEEFVACEQTTTLTSSSTGSGVNAEPSKQSTDDRKRKARETDDHEGHSEDAKFEAENTKKQAHESTSARRARAAEVHNLSERRRRDRINEKMKALQELIPRCNKSDKASMLDEAIEYLKSLQLQVQMMSMGCGMVPMMFPPGVQQYLSPMAMGMGMGMGMDLGLNRPMMMPFSSVLAGRPAVPTAHMGPSLPSRPSLPSPAFNVPPATSNSIGLQSSNSLQSPIFADPYQHYLNNLHHMQVPLPPRPPHQSQAMAQPSTSKRLESDENHKPG